jgi:hypothetical protein
MASGFQQDINQLSPNYYRVIITMSNSSYYPTTNTETTSGAVEPYDYNGFLTLPSSRDNSRRRARGNIRWNNVILNLSKHADCQILDVTPLASATSYTDSNIVTDSLSFTVRYERDNFVLQALNGTADSASATINTVAKAVRELVVQGIIAATTRTYRTMDSVGGNSQFMDSVVVTAPNTGANIYTTVSATLIDTTTVINS